LGYCASGEKEGTEMKGKDGNMWVKKNGKWVKKISKEDYYKKLLDKLPQSLEKLYIKGKLVDKNPIFSS
jgi:hypothetical protein